ncbi:MAG TPA: encapsulin-associated ferritin-like protein [Stellaceae bacterium]|nr:encapsulin-associated ferritin-like protein [Stellaceae bacterium]
MSSENLHEDANVIGAAVVDRHRAIVSLMEELEATDWYEQRVAATADEELKAILAHNRDEEKEHAAMVLEWLRRHDPVLDANLRKYLFTEDPLTALVAEEKAEPPVPVAPEGHLGIGDLRGDNSNEPAAPAHRRAANER